MLNILFFISILFLAACSHVSVLQLGEGDKSNTSVESCAHHFLAFPLNAEDGSADGLLAPYSLSPKDIYAIDTRSWYYLFPLYFKYCHRAQLNTQGEAQYLKISQQLATTKKVEKKAGAPDEFRYILDVKECDEFKSLKRDRCVEYLNKTFSK